MNVKRSLVVAGAVATVGLAGLGGTAAFAQTNSSGDTLIDKIATKFNLNKDEVKSVFDEDRAAHEAEREQEMSDRLQALVEEGKITAEQKTLIETKAKESKAAHETERTALEDWAKQNNIDAKYILQGMMGRPGQDDNSDRLQTLVDKGNITAEQKKLLEDKAAELKAKHESERTALEKWASDNNIDTQYLMMGGPGARSGKMMR